MNIIKQVFWKILGLVANIWQKISPQALVVVLMYHNIDNGNWKLGVSPKNLENQFNWLFDRAKVITLDQVVDFKLGLLNLKPGLYVAITFDDGYEDIKKNVLPLLKKYKYPATVFLTTNLSYTDSIGIGLRPSLNSLKEWVGSGFISIQSHGHDHLHFDQLSVEIINEQIKKSCQEIVNYSGKMPKYFSYPFGRRSKEVIDCLKNNNIKAAFGISANLITKNSQLYALPRLQVDRNTTINLLSGQLSLAIYWVSFVKKFINKYL